MIENNEKGMIENEKMIESEKEMESEKEVENEKRNVSEEKMESEKDEVVINAEMETNEEVIGQLHGQKMEKNLRQTTYQNT